MRLRNISRIIVIALVALVGAVALIRQQLAAHQAVTKLTGGTELSAATPAFTLHDQTGAVVSTQSLHGRPVVVTFMDMTCTEECPIIAQELQLSANFLGPQKAAQVEWVVISVNPTNTPADATAFLKKQNVTIPVHVLLGTHDDLSPVWKKFGIYVGPQTSDVVHTAATFLIDRNGTERMVFLDSVDSKALAGDISALLAEK
jgi:cytochrome oxidase Cu insertion factor (SCO1/SenC/PrrC family)